MTLSIFYLSNAERHVFYCYAECRYAECRFGEAFGLDLCRFAPTVSFGKTPKLERLEEVKVVTRLP